MVKRFLRLCLMHTLILLARLTRQWRSRIPIFVYHSIDDSDSPLSTSNAVFSQRMAYLLKHGFKCLSGGAAIASFASPKNLTRPSVGITFDDAYQSIIPVLKKMAEKDLACTVFVPSSLIGQSNLWDKDHTDLPQLPIMSADALRDAHLHPNTEIGAHTRTHPPLPEVSDEILDVELGDARGDLEDLFETQVSMVAYPFGSHNPRVIQAARDQGYRAGFTTRLGYLTPETDRMQIPRFPADLDFLQFQLVVYGGYEWYRFLQNHLFGKL